MSKRRGGVMVLTLAVLTGLVAIVAMVASTQRLAFRATLNSLEKERAEIAAEAGVQYALATLATQSKTATNLTDEWAELGQLGDEMFLIGNNSFRIEIVDAASRLNLNEASREQLQRIGLTDEQLDSLLDWRDAELIPRTDGAKDEYYNDLPEPYNAKLQDFDSIDELLLVKGFTPYDLYQPLENAVEIQGTSEADLYLSELITAESVSDDSSPDGQAKLNVNSQQASVQALVQAQIPPILAAQIVQRRTTIGPFTSISQVLGLPGVTTTVAGTVIDRLSVGGQRRVEGRININTATEEVLNTIEAIPPDVAQAIVSRQASSGFASLGELATLPGMTTAILGQVATLFSVNSHTFIVRAVGQIGQTTFATEVLVSIEGDSPKVLRRSNPPEGYFTRWGWAEEASSETVIMEAV
jgi:type II secretory pathway component PulK